MRTVGVVTVARSDYGIYQPVLRAIHDDPELQLLLYVSGMHLSPEFGMTVEAIEKDGFPIEERIETLLSSDTPQGIAKSIGLGAMGFGQAFARRRPDLLVVLGDRFEMLAAVVAALPFTIPIAHIHGGEATEGAIDEAIRHSITKMSHLHFVATEAYGRRVIQMGEEPWRVVVSGAPALDHIHSLPLLSREELTAVIGVSLDPPPLLVTFHPVTLEYGDTRWQVTELLAALAQTDFPVVFTYPNADTAGRLIIEAIEEFARSRANARAIPNLGTRSYYSLMKYAAAMVGNSSSGIIEAASFGLPAVNIGNRQKGRLHGPNVIHSTYERDAILGAIRTATDPGFRAGLVGLRNPYGDGKAAQRVVQVLRQVSLDRKLIVKPFYDLGSPEAT